MSKKMILCFALNETERRVSSVSLYWALLVCLLSTAGRSSALMNHTGTWTGKNYPDLRGPTRHLCGPHMPARHYLCDPDRLIGKEDAKRLNVRLHALTNSTKCKCKRIGQCIGEDLNGNQVAVGFIVGVAFAKRLSPLFEPITDSHQLYHPQPPFWQTINQMLFKDLCKFEKVTIQLYILPDRLTRSYLTLAEAEKIQEKVHSLVAKGDYIHALDIVLKEIEKELQGEEEQRIDTGKLSLIISVSVAIVFVFIITGCVCAFRCCGNLRPDSESALGQTLERVDSLKAEVIRRGSQLRRSLSRSPKLPHHQASHRLDHAVPLIQSQAARGDSSTPSPKFASNRQLLAAQQLSKRSNMARLATPYYGVEDGHSMV